MLIETHPVSPWQANCYVVATSQGDPQLPKSCIVIDPGITSFEVISENLARRGWHPEAVLLTHGHLDHCGDAHKVAAAWGIPVYCPVGDLPMLTRPSLGLGESFIGLIQQIMGADELPSPAEVRNYPERFEIAGLSVVPFNAPGHTAGSTLLEVRDGVSSVVFTGDVVFAGAIGRTDLPSGSMEQMRDTLRRIRDAFPDESQFLPGHGPRTTLAAEKFGNRFMQDEM